MDRKPENGCEILSLCCGCTHILISLEIVSSKEDTDRREYAGEMKHGAAVVCRMTKALHNSYRTVVGDSAFASVDTALELLKRGLFFIGIIKTAHANFPKDELGSVVLNSVGAHRAMSATVDGYLLEL